VDAFSPRRTSRRAGRGRVPARVPSGREIAAIVTRDRHANTACLAAQCGAGRRWRF